MPNANTNVALLYQTQELGRHLRDALTSLGTPIVYEAATDHLDPSALEQSGARVVIVNLDPEVEAHLDEVYGLLEDDRYSVVFNDAQVSSGLSGWDQARWARHLAAKILGAGDLDPPRPEGAEAIPVPVIAAANEANAEPVADADEIVLASTHDADEIEVASSPEPAANYDARLQSIVDGAMADAVPVASAGDPLDMLESRYEEMNQPADAAFPSPPPPPADGFDFSTLEALTAAPPSAAEPVVDEPVVDEPPFAATLETDAETVPTEHVAKLPSSHEEEEHVSADSIADVFDLDALDKLFGDTPGEAGSDRVAPAFDASADSPLEAPPVPTDIGNIDFGDLDAGDASGEKNADASPKTDSIERSSGSLALDDISLDDAPAAPRASAPPPPSTMKLAAAADWSLEDMLEGDAPPPAPVPTGRADFGIEKVSASDYLAPSQENTAPPPEPDDGFSLELMPLEEAMAPQQVEREAHEAWLDPDKVVVPAKIRRVFVLGASIGGPEAVRDFLRELPRDYPALFVLAQHMGAEFVDLMAQQLAKATPLTVRTPTHGERVGHGEVVIVPTTHRLTIDPEGIVVLERVASDGAYSPSIDRVLRDVADKYGASASAIVFSGMTNDAVEGAKHLVSKGGAVYAQHPDTCVVSSMVDGVVEAGIVKFLGSPSELAQQLIAETAAAKKR